MILIYSHILSPRITYVLDLVFRTVLQTTYELTSDRQAFEASALPKLAYTTDPDIATLRIRPHGLLAEKTIEEIRPVADKEHKGFPLFFPSPDHDFLGYDLFATVFYFASRYEEYLPHETDQHGRFKAEESIAFNHHCLHVPFLNQAIDDFAKKLKQEFPTLEFKEQKFHVLSTIDIDNAFAYAHKGFVRNAGGLLKDMLSGNFKTASERLVANRNDAKDRYNTFNLIASLSKETQTPLQYFVLIGDYAAYDKNPHHANPGFQKLLRGLAKDHEMGLHPSYQSASDPGRIAIEKERLETIIGRPVTSARCHFLKVKFPQTYRAFIQAGITDDYTMIYASQCGFRTGLCVPYKWFDLEKNEATSLTIHTSVVMEGTLRDYNKLPAEKAKEVCSAMMSEVKKYGGEFISIFHNDSFVPEQKDWITVYQHTLRESRKP